MSLKNHKGVGLLMETILNYIYNLISKYLFPYLHSPGKLKGNVSTKGYTFTFFKPKQVLPEWMRPKRDSSGLMWEGWSAGIRKDNGKVVSIWIELYGTNSGIGHYLCDVKSDTWDSHVYYDGHFHLKPFGGPREHQVLIGACERVIQEYLSKICDPVVTLFDEKGNLLELYEPQSGREIFVNKSRSDSMDDLFVVGPHPTKTDEIEIHSCSTLDISEMALEREDNGLIQFMVNPSKDIYGKLLNHTSFEMFNSESGYRYKQSIQREPVVLTAPSTLSSITIRIDRGGYKSVEKEINLKVSSMHKVQAFLEPLIDRNSQERINQ